MIGANFEPLEAGITRVGWIRSDGSAYIDLDYAVRWDTSDPAVFHSLEVDATFPNGVNDAPGYVFGTTELFGSPQLAKLLALKTAANPVTYYKALNGKTLNEYYANGVPTRISTIDTALYPGSIWTDTSGNVTALTVVRRPLTRISSGLTWDMTSGGVSAHYPLESLSGYIGHNMEILDDTTFRNNTLGYVQSVDMQTGTVTITSTAGDGQTISFQYAYPELREAYTQHEQHCLAFEFMDADNLYIDDSEAVVNGFRHRVMFRSPGIWGSGNFVIDRASRMDSEDLGYMPGDPPNASMFLFARNDGTLNATSANPSMKVHGVKMLDLSGNSDVSPNAVCTRHLVAAVKAGAGAGLYDIINGKFYAARGGTMLYGGTQT